MDKRFWAIIGVIVVVFGGIIFVNNHKTNTNNSDSSQATNHVEGNAKASVTLVEYGDYQCPVCEGYYAVVQQVQAKYNDTVKFQFRNLPLTQLHPNAFAAARAAEAADMQGQFWEMHNMLYAQANWSEWYKSDNAVAFFNSYAKQLKLNVDKFKKDFASAAVNNRINSDIAAFKKTKQEMATPSFFINGKYYANTNFVNSSQEPTVEAFSKVLDKALADAAKQQ